MHANLRMSNACFCSANKPNNTFTLTAICVWAYVSVCLRSQAHVYMPNNFDVSTCFAGM